MSLLAAVIIQVQQVSFKPGLTVSQGRSGIDAGSELQTTGNHAW